MSNLDSKCFITDELKLTPLCEMEMASLDGGYTLNEYLSAAAWEAQKFASGFAQGFRDGLNSWGNFLD